MADVLTQLQDQTNLLCSRLFNFLGALQRDAPPVSVKGEGVLLPNAGTIDAQVIRSFLQDSTGRGRPPGQSPHWFPEGSTRRLSRVWSTWWPAARPHRPNLPAPRSFSGGQAQTELMANELVESLSALGALAAALPPTDKAEAAQVRPGFVLPLVPAVGLTQGLQGYGKGLGCLLAFAQVGKSPLRSSCELLAVSGGSIGHSLLESAVKVWVSPLPGRLLVPVFDPPVHVRHKCAGGGNSGAAGGQRTGLGGAARRAGCGGGAAGAAARCVCGAGGPAAGGGAAGCRGRGSGGRRGGGGG